MFKDLQNFRFRISSLFSCSFAILVAWDFISIAVYWVLGVFKWGWHEPSLWYFQFMMEDPLWLLIRFGLPALVFTILIEMFWQICRLSNAFFKISSNLVRK